MGKYSSMFLGIHWKIMILELNKWATLNAVMTCHLIFTTSGTSQIKHPSHTLHLDNWFLVLCCHHFHFRLRTSFSKAQKTYSKNSVSTCLLQLDHAHGYAWWSNIRDITLCTLELSRKRMHFESSSCGMLSL